MLQDKSGADVIIDLETFKARKGDLVLIADTGLNVQIASPKYWEFVTPDTTKQIHISFLGLASAALKMELFEVPTVTVTGTLLTKRNADRNLAEVGTLLAYYDPTVTVDGTLIASKAIGSGGGSAKILDSEIILKRNTIYVVKFTVLANGTNTAIEAKFYEE